MTTYSCKILLDSLAPSGSRLTTFELTYPRTIVHEEFMTHRVFSRNTSSTRAIPFKTAIKKLEEDMFMPIYWPKNGPGMVAINGVLDTVEQKEAERIWTLAFEAAVSHAKALDALGVHKSITGRLLQPFGHITVLVSSTEWENYFHLRTAGDAEPHIQRIALMMEKAFRKNHPVQLKPGQWHLPLIREEDWAEAAKIAPAQKLPMDTIGVLRRISVGRCARVSYLTHDGRRDLQADIDLCAGLEKNGHWSPFEHVALALESRLRSGNFHGWQQYRHMFTDENWTRLPGEAV